MDDFTPEQRKKKVLVNKWVDKTKRVALEHRF